jgi:hypothetical protein
VIATGALSSEKVLVVGTRSFPASTAFADLCPAIGRATVRSNKLDAALLDLRRGGTGRTPTRAADSSWIRRGRAAKSVPAAVAATSGRGADP